MNLNLRPLLLLLAMLLVFSIGMASLLNYFKFQSTVKKLQRDRISLIAGEVQRAVERGNSLGAELATSATIQAMIERQLKSDALVMLIEIFDENGKTLFSTDAARKDSVAPSAWTAAAYRLKTAQWSLAEKTSFVTGIVLKNSFDLTIGSVAVRYDRNGLDRTVAGMGRYIGKIGLATAAGTFVLCGLAFWLLSRMMRADAARAEQMPGENGSGLDGPRLDGPAQDAPIQREMRALRQAAAAAKNAMAGIERSLLPTRSGGK